MEHEALFIQRDHEGRLVLGPHPGWPNKIDIPRAIATRSLAGEPMIAPPACNYPEGTVIDTFCLVCGSTFASHDEDSDCYLIVEAAALLDVGSQGS